MFARIVRRYLLLTSAVTSVVAAHAAIAADPVIQFDIPAEALSQALKDFSQESSQQIIFSEDLVRGQSAPAVQGKFTAGDALERLLKNSGLVIDRTPSGTVMVERSDRPRRSGAASPASGAATADPPEEKPAPPQAQPEAGLENVLVTARKRQESILEVPVVETAIPQAKLERLQTVDMRDLQTIVPGLDLGHQVGVVGTQVSIRGVGTSASDPGVDQSISLNIDGLSLGSGLAFQSGMFDLQQVEVLKGPQALFYGKSSPGGVISLHTADPTDKFEVIGRGSYEFESLSPRGEAIISGPVNDTLRLRLATMYSTAEGYFHNLAVAAPGLGGVTPTLGRAPNTLDYIIRGTALWNPSDKFDARLKLNDAFDRSIVAETAEVDSCPQGAQFAPSGIPFLGGNECKVSRNLRSVYMDPAAFPGIPHNGVPYLLTKQAYGTLELNYRPRTDLTVTSVTAYYRLWERNLLNSTEAMSAGPPLSSDNKLHRHELTEELRANSDFTGPLNFTAGALYEDGQITMFNEAHGNTTLRLPRILSYGTSNVDIKAYSAFGQLRYKFVPKLELAAGVRWTDEKRSENVFNFLTNKPNIVPVPHIHSDNAAPEITLTYTPTDDLTAFGAFKQAYKSGSFSIGALPTAGFNNSFGDEKVQGGEAGIKSRLLDRQLAVNVAAFYYHYSGLQVGASLVGPNGLPATQTVNAGSARTYGVDFDTAYRPDSVPGLQVNAALNWDKAHYLVLNNAPCWGGQTIAQGCNQVLNPVSGLYTAQNMSGTPLLRAPEWQMTFGFDYEFPIRGDYKLVFTNSNQYSSKYVTVLAVGRPTPDNYQTSFAKVDLGLTLDAPNNRWSIALVGKDITDKITTGACGYSNAANGAILGGEITGGTGVGRAGIDEATCFMDPGRQIWLRLTLRPFAG